MEKIIRYYKKRHEAMRYGKWIWRQMKPHILLIIILSVIGSLFSVIGIGTSAISKWLVDAATGISRTFDIRIFLLMCIVMIFNAVANSGFSIAKTFLYEKFSFRMRKDFYGQLLWSDWQGLSSYHSGDLMTRLTSDIDIVANGVFSLLPSLISLFSQFAAAFFLLFHYDSLLALMVLFISPFGVLLSMVMSRLYAKFQKQSVENEAAYRSFMQESTEHLILMKSFSLEEASFGKLEMFWKKRIKILKKRSLVSFWLGLAMTFIFSGSYLLVFGWSVYRLSKGEITYGTMTFMITLVSQVQSPIRSLQGLIQQMVNVLISSGRIMEINALPRESLKAPAILSGALGIRAEKLSFMYEKGDCQVLNNISFTVAPGEIIGVVGSSGAGKTTLIRLFLALVLPKEGNLFVYDENGKEVAVSVATRQYFNYVPQGNTLMSGSIRENLCIGNPSADEEAIWAALKVAEADDFVRKLPECLDFKILEKGGAISEGQAQRLAIARAVLKPGKILVLDEATSSLDLNTESKIVQNLKAMAKGVTCIIITHRPSLLDICHKVYQIDQGKLCE